MKTAELQFLMHAVLDGVRRQEARLVCDEACLRRERTTQVRLEKPDDFATKNSVSRLTVSYRDVKATWYVDKTGQPIRIEIPSQQLLVERVSEKQARAFFE